MPQLGIYSFIIFVVEANKADEAKIWSPLFKNGIIEAKTAAIPVAVAKPSSIPSKMHIFSINSEVFGFENRE